MSTGVQHTDPHNVSDHHNSGNHLEKGTLHHQNGHGNVVNSYQEGNQANQGGAFINRNITPGGHPMDNTQPGFTNFHRRFANPAPLGLSAFALTTFILSLVNLRARHVGIPNIVIGSALFYGGLCQLLAGMWEFAVGNTFGATAFSSYGGFWLSYAWTISPWSQVISSYTSADAGAALSSGIGFYLLGWMIFTFIMWLASLRSSIALSSVFFLLTITFALLAAGELAGSTVATKAGGWFGLFTAFNAWYVALANLLTPDTSYFVLPLGPLKRD